MTEPIYILTAEFDANSLTWLDTLRRAHFPPERNMLAAHLTMFHRLSSVQVEHLRTVPLPVGPIAVTFDKVIFLGEGNAIRATSAHLVQLRAELKHAAGDGISRQDAQRWMPHVTIQNKVSADTARRLHAELARDFTVRTGAITGLAVWEYLGGPWRLAQALPFGVSDETDGARPD